MKKKLLVIVALKKTENIVAKKEVVQEKEIVLQGEIIVMIENVVDAHDPDLPVVVVPAHVVEAAVIVRKAHVKVVVDQSLVLAQSHQVVKIKTKIRNPVVNQQKKMKNPLPILTRTRKLMRRKVVAAHDLNLPLKAATIVAVDVILADQDLVPVQDLEDVVIVVLILAPLPAQEVAVIEITAVVIEVVVIVVVKVAVAQDEGIV
jgi:hypothetical protein